MKSYEIIQRMSPGLAAEILGFLQSEQTPIFKSMVQALAGPRKLRPVFIERKPPDQRYAWIKSALGSKSADALAAHVLQAWLLAAEPTMLCDFLDSLGIAHDKDGTVEELPESPSKGELARAIEQMVSRYPAEKIAVYLHAFHDMESTATWPPLGELLAEDQRLKL